MEERIDKRFNALMTNLGEDGGARMMRAADRFLELVEQHALTGRLKEDGSYEIINPQEKPKTSTSE
jgi:hypothetical protein